MKRRGPESCPNKYSHTFEQGVCTKCFELDQASRRQRAFTARLHRLLNEPDPFAVPAPPDYSTHEAVTARCLEYAEPWYRHFMTMTDGLHARFRKAVERAGGQLELLPALSRRRRRAA